MPYIKQELRQELDPTIDRVINDILNLSTRDNISGILNYVCTRIILAGFRFNFAELNYHVITLISGLLSTMKDEFYRRVAAPYEDRKRAENGDVYDG